MDLAATHLKDVAGGEIERLEIHIDVVDAGHAHDLHYFLVHRLPKLREAKDETGFRVRDFHAPRFNGFDIAHHFCVELSGASHRAHRPKAAWSGRWGITGRLSS